jgi:hypothetical protein
MPSLISVLQVERIAVLRSDADWVDIAADWRATWSPESLAPVLAFCEAAGWQVARFDPPSDVEATFSAVRLLR